MKSIVQGITGLGLVLLLQSELLGNSVLVESAKGLKEALRNPVITKIILGAECVFESEDGFEVGLRGDEDGTKPLLIAGEKLEPGSFPLVRSKFIVKRSNVLVKGIRFIDSNLVFTAEEGGYGGKVLRCYFENATGDFWQPDMEVAYNELWDVRSIGFEFKFPVLGEAAYPVGDERWKGCKEGAFRAHIHHNYFHDWIGEGNGHEGFRIGTSNHHRFWEADGLAEYNLFDNVAVVGEGETISIKSSGNVIRYNTLLRSQSISQRHGTGNRFYGNYIEDSHGIAIMDGRIINGEKRRNWVYANTLVNCWLGIHARAGFSNADNVGYIWNRANDVGDPERNIPKIEIPESYQIDHPISGWNHVSRLSARYAVIAGNLLINSPIEIGRPDPGATIPTFELVVYGNQYLDTIVSESQISRLHYTIERDTIPADPAAEPAIAPPGFDKLDISRRAFRLTRDMVGPQAGLHL